jgi:hypothetical protein
MLTSTTRQAGINKIPRYAYKDHPKRCGLELLARLCSMNPVEEPT